MSGPQDPRHAHNDANDAQWDQFAMHHVTGALPGRARPRKTHASMHLSSPRSPVMPAQARMTHGTFGPDRILSPPYGRYAQLCSHLLQCKGFFNCRTAGLCLCLCLRTFLCCAQHKIIAAYDKCIEHDCRVQFLLSSPDTAPCPSARRRLSDSAAVQAHSPSGLRRDHPGLSLRDVQRHTQRLLQQLGAPSTDPFRQALAFIAMSFGLIPGGHIHACACSVFFAPSWPSSYGIVWEQQASLV